MEVKNNSDILENKVNQNKNSTNTTVDIMDTTITGHPNGLEGFSLYTQATDDYVRLIMRITVNGAKHYETIWSKPLSDYTSKKEIK